MNCLAKREIGRGTEVKSNWGRGVDEINSGKGGRDIVQNIVKEKE